MPINDADMIIKVREKAHAAILDRDTVTADAKKHLTPWLGLLCSGTIFFAGFRLQFSTGTLLRGREKHGNTSGQRSGTLGSL